MPEKKVDKLQEEFDRLKRRKYRIEASIDRKNSNASVYESSNDDIIVQEIHLVKNQPYTFKFRSKDVIHCPWFPHFRAQINAVPGMETSFALTPTITTAEMRANPDVIKHWENINFIHNERKRTIAIRTKNTNNGPNTGLFAKLKKVTIIFKRLLKTIF